MIRVAYSLRLALRRRTKARSKRRFIKFVCIGLVNTAFGYLVFALVYIATKSYQLGIAIATLIGITFNFFSIGTLVFENRRPSAFVPFAVVYGVACVTNIGVVDRLVAVGLRPLIAQLVALPPIVLLSYTLNDRFVFGRP